MKTPAHSKQHAYIDGVRDRVAERLTPSQWRMLFDIRDHGDPMYSRSDRAAGTLGSLRRLGLIDRAEKLTPAGIRTCRVEWRNDRDESAATRKK